MARKTRKTPKPPRARDKRVAEVCEDIVLACHMLAREGQGDAVWGHVSGRDPGGRGFWMKPARMGIEEVLVSDLILISLDGEIGRAHV